MAYRDNGKIRCHGCRLLERNCKCETYRPLRPKRVFTAKVRYQLAGRLPMLPHSDEEAK